MADPTNVQDDFIDVRYSKLYTGFTIALALVFLMFIVTYAGSHKEDLFEFPGIIFPSIYTFFGLMLLYGGITLRSRKYLRLDKENKMLLVYGLFGPWSRKYTFDFMYFAGEKFHIDLGGKKLRIPILKYMCDKSDLGILLKELSEFNRRL